MPDDSHMTLTPPFLGSSYKGTAMQTDGIKFWHDHWRDVAHSREERIEELETALQFLLDELASTSSHAFLMVARARAEKLIADTVAA